MIAPDLDALESVRRVSVLRPDLRAAAGTMMERAVPNWIEYTREAQRLLAAAGAQLLAAGVEYRDDALTRAIAEFLALPVAEFSAR